MVREVGKCSRFSRLWKLLETNVGGDILKEIANLQKSAPVIPIEFFLICYFLPNPGRYLPALTEKNKTEKLPPVGIESLTF